VEVVCEFRFAQSSPWDAAIPGQVFQALENKLFPKKKSERTIEAKVDTTDKGLTQHVTTAERLVLLSEDERQFARIGERFLSIHRVEPYTSWAEFKPVIEKALGALNAVAEPSGFQRVGLRYLNRIEFPLDRVEVEEHFTFCLHVGEDLPQDYGPFMAGALFEDFREGRNSLRMQLSSASPGPEGQINVMLDLDYFLTDPESLTADEVPSWLSDAHEAIKKAFFASITDKTMGLFTD